MAKNALMLSSHILTPAEARDNEEKDKPHVAAPIIERRKGIYSVPSVESSRGKLQGTRPHLTDNLLDEIFPLVKATLASVW